VSMKWAADL